MAGDINKVILIGRLVRDPELRHTPNGTSVADFTVASNRTYTLGGEKKEEVSFIKCTAWSKAAEIITQYCKKGQRIAVEGRLKQHSWDDQQTGQKRSSIEVVIDNFQFLSPKGSDVGDNSAVTEQTSEYSEPDNGYQKPFSDDEIPF
jgi:single-strand DNA-binding protein